MSARTIEVAGRSSEVWEWYNDMAANKAIDPGSRPHSKGFRAARKLVLAKSLEGDPVALPDVKRMSTADLEALLDAISLERAKREPQVSMEQPKTMEAALDPRWHISLAEANTILQLRHPGYGWVAYVIPPASRATFLSALLQHALMPPSKPDAPVPVASTGGGTVH